MRDREPARLVDGLCQTRVGKFRGRDLGEVELGRVPVVWGKGRYREVMGSSLENNMTMLTITIIMVTPVGSCGLAAATTKTETQQHTC